MTGRAGRGRYPRRNLRRYRRRPYESAAAVIGRAKSLSIKRSRPSPALAVPQSIHEQAESRRCLTAAWIIKVISGIRRAPILEHPLQPSLGEMRRGDVFRDIG